MFFYNAYGLTIRSDLHLPQLSSAYSVHDNCQSRQGEVSIHLRFDSQHMDPQNNQSSYHEISRENALLVIRNLCTFHIYQGKKITIHPAKNFDEQMIQLILINSILAIVLYQRKMLVLHASSMRIGDIAVAFLGTSGAGKSLIAGALYARGHSLITDDIAPVELFPATPRVYSGYPMIKMKPHESSLLGFPDQCNKLLHAREQKYGCSVHDRFTKVPLPLGHIFVLSIGGKRTIHRLSQRESFMELICHSPPGIWNLPPDQLHFSDLGELVKRVPVSRVTREDCLDALPEHAYMIEEYLRNGARP